MMFAESRTARSFAIRSRILLVFALIAALASPTTPAAAADPLPVASPAGGATTPTTPADPQIATQSSTSFDTGDVFVAVGNGQVQWRLPDGTLNATLDTGLGGYTTGMAFGKQPGNLYVTNFSAGAVTRFDTSGNRLGTFGTGYNSQPESILFDAAGDAYVGQAGGTADVLHFDGGGQLRASYDVPTEDRGSDWIDLSADQCTLLYTSEGTRIMRYDICDHTALPDVTNLLTKAYALRILPEPRSGILVADTASIKLIDAYVGAIIETYDAPGQDCWFALNLDPDGTSFWSADFCTSMVYRFRIADGSVITSFSTGTPSGTVFGLVVNGEFSDARNRTCPSEDLSRGQAGNVGDQVVVRYDPRFLVDENKATYTTQAQEMAERIRSRAVATLTEYRDQLGFSIPDHVTIEIRCEIRPLDLLPPIHPGGFTESENLVKLRADYIRDWMLDPSNNDPNATWKTLVDHELQHTIQVKARKLVLPFLNVFDALIRYSFGDATNMESSAQLAQDLIDESDDAGELPGSYLEQTRLWLGAPSTIAAGPDDKDNDGLLKYRAGAFLQYLGERYGTGATPETKVAEFLRRLYGTHTGTDAIGLAVPADPYELLRAFYVTARIRRAPNAAIYPEYRILDEIRLHGGVAGSPPLYPPIAVRETKPLAAAQFTGQHLAGAQGAVYVVDTFNGASNVRVTVSRSLLNALAQGTTRLAFIPTASDGSVFVDPRNMPDGPWLTGDSWVVPVAGWSELAIMVIATGTDADFDLTVEDAGGVSAIDLLRPTAADPAPPLESACTNTYLPVTVRPTVDGAFADGRPAVAFTASLDGSAVPVSSAVELVDSYLVLLRPATKPSVGDHTIVVSFNGVTAPQIGQISVVQTSSCTTDRQRVRAASLGTLGQGGTASTTVPVTAGDAAATFELGWSGSDFDLTLVAPSGRTITETTVASDVHVIQAASSVQITLDTPEAGAWTVRATGVDVPSPEPVTYAVTEVGTAVRTEFSATAQGTAGDPISVRLALTDDSLGLVDATVEATVIDPAGVVRHFQLFDDGGHGDTGANDGVYGTLAWATESPGTYHVVVSATATRADGTTVEREEATDVVLGTKVDTDSDGVADWSETRFGLNPADPADGATDFDGDGLGLAGELAAGLDPFSWDTDGGGERDASEVAAGRDPRRSGDDHTFPSVLLAPAAKDGNLVSISTATSDQSGQVHLYRFAGASRTDLGLRPGTDTRIDDGPLPAGTYRYAAVAVAGDGAESAPVFSPPVEVAADVTAPVVRISANDGVWATNRRDARIVFTDLSEPVSEMRLAESEADLAAAPWVPYTNPTVFTVGPDEGRHFVLAQVRDAAGNASGIASTVVDLDTTAPTSSVAGLPSATATSPTDVSYTATDTGTGVRTVELYTRSRPTPTDPWGDWTLAAAATTSPISYAFPAGEGQYEFYTIAIDEAGNREDPPVSADAATTFDQTPPATSADPLDPQYSTAAVDVPFTASDNLSGVASVELWSRYRATDTDPWGAWTLGPTGTSSPITYTFGSDGFYEFYTIGIDLTGNREAAPPSADASTQLIGEVTTGSVTRTFSFVSGLESWSGDGTNCTSQHTAADGVPPGSLSTTVSGKNKIATCLWRSPVATWQSWGVPAGATVVAVRLGSAATRIATCSGCRSGQINGYRLETGPGEAVATLWTGRTLPGSQESWQTTGAQPDQQIGPFWQGSNSQIRLRLDATLNTGNPGSSSVTLRQDEIVLVITYQQGGGLPPDYSATLSAVGPYCPVGMLCTNEAEPVYLTGSGTAAASGPVAVEWRLYGVASDGSISLLQPFSAATPVDGAFDEAQEEFAISDARPDQGFASYDVEIRATSQGVSTTRTVRVGISRCDPAAC